MKLTYLYASAIIVMVLAIVFEREIVYLIGKVGSVIIFIFIELIIIANIFNNQNPEE